MDKYSVVKDHIVHGYAVNQKRLTQLGDVVKLLKHMENSLDAKQVLTVVEKYSEALDLLDAYESPACGINWETIVR